jgi:hypothetical protein
MIEGLDQLAALVEGSRDDLYVRWSRGPQHDLRQSDEPQSSIDGLTGLRLPGLSANPLRNCGRSSGGARCTNAEPGSASQEALDLLASWTATPRERLAARPAD